LKSLQFPNTFVKSFLKLCQHLVQNELTIKIFDCKCILIYTISLINDSLIFFAPKNLKKQIQGNEAKVHKILTKITK
jgi:hypothetical protein